MSKPSHHYFVVMYDSITAQWNWAYEMERHVFKDGAVFHDEQWGTATQHKQGGAEGVEGIDNEAADRIESAIARLNKEGKCPSIKFPASSSAGTPSH